MLGAIPITLTTRAAGSYVAGVWTPGEATTSTILGSPQPLTGRQREKLPEGLRTKQTLRLFTTAVLSPLSIAGPTACDQVTIDGRLYDVDVLSDWSKHAAPTAHREYLLIERGQDEVTP